MKLSPAMQKALEAMGERVWTSHPVVTWRGDVEVVEGGGQGD